MIEPPPPLFASYFYITVGRKQPYWDTNFTCFLKKNKHPKTRKTNRGFILRMYRNLYSKCPKIHILGILITSEPHCSFSLIFLNILLRGCSYICSRKHNIIIIDQTSKAPGQFLHRPLASFPTNTMFLDFPPPAPSSFPFPLRNYCEFLPDQKFFQGETMSTKKADKQHLKVRRKPFSGPPTL